MLELNLPKKSINHSTLLSVVSCVLILDNRWLVQTLLAHVGVGHSLYKCHSLLGIHLHFLYIGPWKAFSSWSSLPFSMVNMIGGEFHWVKQIPIPIVEFPIPLPPHMRGMIYDLVEHFPLSIVKILATPYTHMHTIHTSEQLAQGDVCLIVLNSFQV